LQARLNPRISRTDGYRPWKNNPAVAVDDVKQQGIVGELDNVAVNGAWSIMMITRRSADILADRSRTKHGKDFFLCPRCSTVGMATAISARRWDTTPQRRRRQKIALVRTP
jgi:hypothetical protein